MAIRKRLISGGEARFVALYRDPSGKQCSAGSFTTERAAKLALGDIEKAKFSGTYRRLEPISFKECALLYINERCQARPGTLRNYNEILEARIYPSISAHPVGSITGLDITKILKGMAGKSRSYARETRRLLKAIFAYAVDSGYASKNPVLSCPKIGKSLNKPKIKTLTTQEINRLLKGVEDFRGYVLGESPKGKKWGTSYSPKYHLWRKMMVKLYYKTILFTGLRPCEASALTWEDVDFEKRVLRISKSLDFFKKKAEHIGSAAWIIQDPKTPAGLRTIPMGRELLKDLQILKIEWPENPKNLVFTAFHGGPVNEELINKRHFKEDLRRAGIAPTTLYKLRHTYCSLVISQRHMTLEELKNLQYLMGHEHFETTMDIYAQISKENLGHIADDLELQILGRVNILSTNPSKID